MMRAVLGAVVTTLTLVSSAWAQSDPGVSVALVGDIVRLDGGDSPLVGGVSRNGEALTFALRVDQALGSRWGVELEYVHGGELERESVSTPLSTQLSMSLTGSGLGGFPAYIGIYRSTTRTRLSTVSPTLWYRQSVGSRTSLVYSAGMAFGISRSAYRFEVTGLPTQLTIPPTSVDYTSYSVNPVVGIDARIALTDHAAIVPGMRLIGGNGGIILRPAVGLRWQF